jgi:hypothetical protein
MKIRNDSSWRPERCRAELRRLIGWMYHLSASVGFSYPEIRIAVSLSHERYDNIRQRNMVAPGRRDSRLFAFKELDAAR